MYTSLFCLYKKSGLLPSIFVFYSSEHNLVFYQFLISLLSIRKKENLGFNEICISSGLLVAYGDSLIPKVVVGFAACGDSLIPKVVVGFAAYGGKAHNHQKTLANRLGSEESRRMEPE